jgi:hypothetical protein
MKKYYVIKNPLNGKYFTNDGEFVPYWSENFFDAYHYTEDTNMDAIIAGLFSNYQNSNAPFVGIDYVEVVMIYKR